MSHPSLRLRVGLFLGLRQLRRANRWTAALTVLVMTLTFLNLVVVSGILVGLIQGSVNANKRQNTADVFVSALPGEPYIKQSERAIATAAAAPGVTRYSARTIVGGRIEANYRTRRDPTADRDTASSQVTGIDLLAEDAVTGLASHVVEGRYLRPGESGAILLGAKLIDRYSAAFGDGLATVERVYPGDRVRLTVASSTREYEVVGIVNSKVNQTSLRVFMDEAELRHLANRTSGDVNEIAVQLAPGASADVAKQAMLAQGLGDLARVRTFEEAIPDFLIQIRDTFGVLGNLIGVVGLAVGSITIFIVVFVSAVTRRKQIGIMKAIGVAPSSIVVAYVTQAIAYSGLGIALGALATFGLLVPLVDAHPINFPFSDGILVATPLGTGLRAALLLGATAIAGIVPAWLIVRQNTLDVILGR